MRVSVLKYWRQLDYTMASVHSDPETYYLETHARKDECEWDAVRKPCGRVGTRKTRHEFPRFTISASISLIPASAG